jgi:hypothetical protein
MSLLIICLHNANPLAQRYGPSPMSFRVNVPPLQTDTDPLSEHASYSSTFHTHYTGTTLLRVIHGSLMLDFFPLSTDVPPIHFFVPLKSCLLQLTLHWNATKYTFCLLTL